MQKLKESNVNYQSYSAHDNSLGAVSIIGLGYVGLPLAMAFAEKGIKVIGIDKDSDKIEMLRKGTSYIDDVSNKKIKTNLKYFYPTADFSLLSEVNNVIICVPTPLSESKDPDVSHIISASEEVFEFLHKDMLVVLESTTYPGTTQEVLKSIFEQSGLNAGEDFYLAFSPERIDPGNKTFTIKNTPKVVGGLTEKCTERAVELYSSIVEQVVPVSSPAVAEAVKLLENIFRSVNIALVNEVAQLCYKMKIDIWEVVDAASTKPFGYMPFYPGPGIGGHCIPVDPIYLSWKAKLLNFHTRLIDLANDVNNKMPEYVVYRLSEILQKAYKTIKGSKILVLGVAYKKDVGDMRESPALEVIRLILENGGEVIYNDPYVPEFNFLEASWRSVALDKDVLEKADCVLILTDHSLYDWKSISERAQLLLDTRNAANGISLNHIYRL